MIEFLKQIFLLWNYILIFYEVLYFYVNKTPLYHAIERGNIEIVELLLENPAINVRLLIIMFFLHKISYHFSWCSILFVLIEFL